MFPSHEPDYQGRKLSEWLPNSRQREVQADWDGRSAAVALKDMGAKAIPYLLEGIQAEDMPQKQKVANLLDEYLDWHLKVTPASELHESATMGFFLLGDLGEPAIPALARAITSKNPEIASSAALALWGIGSTNGVRVLVQTLTNSGVALRQQAASLLARMGSKAGEAVPILMTKLEENDVSIRRMAIFTLGSIGGESRIVVERLNRKLTDDSAEVRASAAGWLGTFGTEGVPALAGLQKAQRDPDVTVRKAAAQALIGIQCEMHNRGIVRGPKAERRIALSFTGHEFAEGGETILNELEKHQAKASFFLTGDFIANPRLAPLIHRMTNDSHYLGPHSDKHLIYCNSSDWNKTLISRADFWFDLKANLERLGVEVKWPVYFLPPYAHYNREIADWSRSVGLTLINFTPGTRSNADGTGEADKDFVPSQAIFDSIVRKEREDPHGLNGFILWLHLGSGPGRADKFHNRFGELLDHLSAKGYQFVRVDELLHPKLETAPNEKTETEWK